MKLLAAAFALSAIVAHADDAPFTEKARQEMLAGFTKEVAPLDEAIRAEPQQVALYSRRGDRQLFLGRPTAAIADFEKMIALDPTQDAPHWRLGIAYYFAGAWEKSARQFEKYHAYDARDRENGIWKFLADVRRVGLEKARTQMLEYTRFDREPFPTLYEMFAGTKTTDDLFAHVAERKLTDNGAAMFFAHYYGGLNELLLGHKDRARELLAKAVASAWGQRAEGGPAYMWQCARLHLETTR
jgi:lipoprotein NlpI